MISTLSLITYVILQFIRRLFNSRALFKLRLHNKQRIKMAETNPPAEDETDPQESRGKPQGEDVEAPTGTADENSKNNEGEPKNGVPPEIVLDHSRPHAPPLHNPNLTPYDGAIDPSSKEGFLHWQQATKAPAD